MAVIPMSVSMASFIYMILIVVAMLDGALLLETTMETSLVERTTSECLLAITIENPLDSFYQAVLFP
jgi:hypothetical protein